MRRPSPARTDLPTPEDAIHRYLLLAIGAAAGAIFFIREPSTGAPPRDVPERAVASASTEATRAQLDAGVSELSRWLERTRRDPRTPIDLNVQLLALGRAAIEPAHSPSRPVWEKLDALAAPTVAAPSAPVPAALVEGTSPGRSLNENEGKAEVVIGDDGALATLAILLETGTPLDHELPLPSGKVSVRHLLELTLPALAERRAGRDPWALDLLAFAVLGGMTQHRSALTRQTLATLNRLEREQRRLDAVDGDGAPAQGALERVTAALAERNASENQARELQLSAALFRALAVLGEPELAQRGLRHLNALLSRYQLERDAYRKLIAKAGTPAQRAALHADALEALGRIEQALYGAHLAFRRSDRPGPAPRTATSMRRAANDLLEHLHALQSESAFDTGPASPGPIDTARLARAAAQALRGLRAARVAT
jgi:hypothetical protein